MTEPKSERHKVSLWIKLVVLFHIFAITVWTFPNPSKAVGEGKTPPSGSQWLSYWNQKYLKSSAPISLYLTTTGFWQYWDMFAPDPSQTDLWADADVIYKDGSIRHYQYPRMYLLSIAEKFEKERYRKFFERAGSDDNPFLWTSFALRIAYLNDNLANPPIEVKLYRHSREVAGPGMTQQQEYSSHKYFDYLVELDKLQAMRKGGL